MNDFPKSKRLLNSKQFNVVFRQARKVTMPEFTLLFCQNDVGQARLGMAFSKRFIPKAADRNRIKRILRESFRTNELPAIDIVAVARTGLNRTDNHKLNSRLECAWKKILKLQEK